MISSLAALRAANETVSASFYSPKTQLWLGESQVIPVKLPKAATEKQILPVTVNPPEAVEVLQPATVLPGQTTGFLRVRALRAGGAELRVGDRKLAVKIAENSSAAELAPIPKIISPPAGACLYGKITVGVEVNQADLEAKVSEPKLLLLDGRELAARKQTLASPNSARIYAFDLNADEIPAGPLTLHATAKGEDGVLLASSPVVVSVVRPDESAMISGACADRINDPRPVRYGEKIPLLSPSKDPGAPRYVVNARPDPAWCMKEMVDKPGLYQLTMSVRGTPSMGVFPSVGVVVNDADYAIGASRLVDTEWQRIPIGPPIRLEAGENILTARFLNDSNQGKNNDRNLDLDRYELVRVSTAAAPSSDSGDAMMMSGGGSDEMMMSGAAGSSVFAPPRISFNDRLQGRVVQGPLSLRATCWTGSGAPVATVDLLVNGQTIATQQGRDTIFRVGGLKKGPNTLQVRAYSGGQTASSPVETVFAPADTADVRSVRFTVEDRAWDPGMPQRLEKNRPVAVFYTNGEAVLTLPNDLDGRFAVKMEARGDEFEGPPVVEAFLKGPNGELQKIGEAGVKGERPWPLGETRLDPGAKQIVLRYGNDKAEKGKGDRNWWLRAVALEEVGTTGGDAPQISLLYPKRTPLVVKDANAVVAQVFSPGGIDWTDLVIDGEAQNLKLADESGLGRVVLPLAVSGLKPGDHALQVHSRGKNGQETLSAAIVLRVSSKDADPQYARAVHLLNRFAYGPEPEELADVLIKGGKPWLHERLTRAWNDSGEQAAIQRAWNEYPDAFNKGQVVPRSLAHLLRTSNPARARFVLWTENHFSTWIDKADPLNKWDEHEKFLRLGAAPFGSLLEASASSPAMLVYLDQNRSFANRLNENYAREIMELHTVGVHGGYKQEDVTALASVLTGWSLTTEAPLTGNSKEMKRTFRFDPMLNAAQRFEVFGMEFPATDDLAKRQDRTLMAIEMLASHPATAEFISRKLASHYVSLPPPEPLVKKLSARFLETGGDMTAMLETIAESQEFWESMGKPKVATPLDFSLRLARLSGSGNPGPIRDFLRKSGTGLFERVTPDGYPEADAAYVDSNALLQRWRFTTSLTGSLRKLLPAAMLPTGPAAWEPAAQNRAVDLLSMRLTGLPLPPASREAALDYLAKVAPPETERAKVTATFVAQLPSVSLR